MEKVVLKASRRDVRGKQVGALRRAGKLPAVIYGRHTDPLNISLDAHDANLALGKVGSSTLVTISLDGKEYPTLVRERQRNFIKGNLIHVDFLAVSLTEKLHAEVRIELTGLSLAVKDQNAVLVTGLHSLVDLDIFIRNFLSFIQHGLAKFICFQIFVFNRTHDSIHCPGQIHGSRPRGLQSGRGGF